MSGDAPAPAARRRPPFAVDLAASVVPWCCYWIGLGCGRQALGAALAAVALVALRLPAWRQTKAFEAAIGAWFIVVAIDRGPAPIAALDGWRPALLPLLLAATALVSLAVGRPCTLQYARPLLDRRWWRNVHFLRVNRLLTAMWAAAFLAMAGLALLLPMDTGGRVAVGVASGLLFAATAWATLQFPYWYRLHIFLPRVRAGRDSYHPAPRRRRWMKCR